MRVRKLCALLFLLALCSCVSNTNSLNPAPRVYNGTASVGDFLTITIDTTAHTMSYSNVSNGDSGTIAYTVNGDGSYTLNDPAGNLTAASIVIAAKGLLRFPELQSRLDQTRIHRLTEYFLVGSFVSWLVPLGTLVLLAR